MIKVDYIDSMGSDLSVVNAARVSFDKESKLGVEVEHGVEYSFLKAEDVRLIRYLAKHKHISPFGHAFASFRVHAPIFVARQLVKHKFLRWNEVSRRYVDSEPEYFQPEELRGRADNVKQGSGETLESSFILCGHMEERAEEALELYNILLSKGVCPEQARMVLPQSMMTTWIWSGSLDAFADMCRLRLDPHTQYESRIVAEQINDKMSELFPVSWKELVNA